MAKAWSSARGGEGDSEAVYLVRGSVLSLSFVEPNKPDRPDKPNPPHAPRTLRLHDVPRFRRIRQGRVTAILAGYSLFNALLGWKITREAARPPNAKDPPRCRSKRRAS